MKKINSKYTFSEAVEDTIGHVFPGIFKLDDTTKCLIEQLQKEAKLHYELYMLKKEHEEQGEILYKSYEQLNDKDKKYDELSKRYDKLSKENKELFRQLKWKLTKEEERLNSKINELTKQITEEKAKNDNLTKENEALHDKNDDLTNEVELLKQKDAMRENQIESLNKYIKLLESGSNNQEDDDTKLYPEYHTHDTFKVHNKLAEVVSVLVDKDDDVYGYEVKFVDSDDTFIVYPEEIED